MPKETKESKNNHISANINTNHLCLELLKTIFISNKFDFELYIYYVGIIYV
jgi:hypothetical protein